MGIRIKPLDIEVTQENPFEHDALGRKESVEILARLIRSVQGPGVFGIDADWGYGKTTFMRMLHQYLKNNNVPVVSFNAWESDYVSDPFTAIATELMDDLEKHAVETDAEEQKKKIQAALESAKAVMKTRWPSMMKALLKQVPVAGEALGEVASDFAGHYVDEKVSAYRDARKSVEEFRKALKAIAQGSSENPNEGLLVVMIDELDRCRPSYAVELLEVTKHLFSVDGVVFVVAVNLKQLAHSVQALYGPGFNARGYLGRFFDVDIRLPQPDRSRFIEETMNEVGIKAYLDSVPELEGRGQPEKMLAAFLGETAVSLRTAARAIHHLGIVYGALAGNQVAGGITAAVLIVLRTLDRDLYNRFVRGEASDSEAAHGIVERLGANVRTKLSSEVALFEAWIIACHWGRGRPDDIGSIDTPLTQLYSKIEEGTAQEGTGSNEKDHAKRVLSRALEIRRRYSIDEIGFIATVQRIELLSSELHEL